MGNARSDTDTQVVPGLVEDVQKVRSDLNDAWTQSPLASWVLGESTPLVLRRSLVWLKVSNPSL